MRPVLFILVLFLLSGKLSAQQVYTIKADSVKLTGCDSSELIIENHTQHVPGFLFNTGNGRTQFKRAVIRIDDSFYLIGADTLKMQQSPVISAANGVSRINNLIQLGQPVGQSGSPAALTGNVEIPLNSNTLNITGTRASSPFSSSFQDESDDYFHSGFISNSFMRIRIDNTDTGNSAGAGVLLLNDVSHGSYLFSASKQNAFLPDGFAIVSNGGTGGIGFVASAGPVTFGNYPFAPYSAGEYARFTNGGNFLLGSAIDNGYKLQVNGNLFAGGTQHLIGNLGIGKGADVGNIGTAIGIRSDDGNSSFILEGSNQGWATDMFTFQTGYGDIGKEVYNTDGSIIKIKSGFVNANVGNLSANTLSINPTYNLITGSWPMTFRGIYYNPILTNLGTGSRHIAIETVTGDVLLGTTSGTVGIGTNSPSAQLHTTGTVRFAGLAGDNTQTRVLVSDVNGNLYYRDASTLADNGISSSDLASGKVVLSSLAVNGNISANRLQLSQKGWPDYVFAPDYQLPTPDSLERYIRRNGHLPGIVSAAEVEKKGIDVAENESALLQKIEEMTLYLLRQDKTIREQSEEIAKLKQKNEQLTGLNDQLQEMRKELTLLQSKLNK